MDQRYAVYIMTNKNNTTLYTGMTCNLPLRVIEHKEKRFDGFSKRYNLLKLVYFEYLNDNEAASKREKQIKAGSRKKKLDLVNSVNPEWIDLFGSSELNLKT